VRDPLAVAAVLFAIDAVFERPPHGEEEMTIDERLERLIERHEALTQTLELQNLQWEERFSRLVGLVERIGQSIETLGRIAEMREHRLNRLEGPSAA
jgi:hypothetical protein